MVLIAIPPSLPPPTQVGTLQYMAPELLQKHPASYASDVYAFAVTLNELATQTFPYSDCTRPNPKAHTILEMNYNQQDLLTAVVAENLRPILPNRYPVGYGKLMRKCWALDPSLRPTMADVADALAGVVAALNKGEYEEDDVRLNAEVGMVSPRAYRDVGTGGADSGEEGKGKDGSPSKGPMAKLHSFISKR